MKDYSTEVVFCLLIICLTTIILSYMQWCKEYDSKIISINRVVYTLKFENGRYISSIQDEINK